MRQSVSAWKGLIKVFDATGLGYCGETGCHVIAPFLDLVVIYKSSLKIAPAFWMRVQFSYSFAGARNPVSASKRYSGHGRGFNGESNHVFRLEIKHVAFTAGPGEGLHLQSQCC